MAVGHLTGELEDVAAVCVGKAPPVNLNQLNVAVLGQIFLSNVVCRIYVACMAGDEDKILDAVFNELSHEEIQIVLEDLSRHREGAGKCCQSRGLAALDGGGDHGACLFRHQFGDSLCHD